MGITKRIVQKRERGEYISVDEYRVLERMKNRTQENRIESPPGGSVLLAPLVSQEELSNRREDDLL